MGFRDPLLGTDAQNYENTFYFISQDVDVQLEPFWIFLNKAVYFFGGDYSDVIWISSLLMLIPVYSACFLVNKKYFIFSIFLFLTLYYYFYGFNIIRQGIGMSWGLLFLAIRSSQIKKSSLKSWIALIIGIGFHFSTISILLFLVLKFVFQKVQFFFLIQLATAVFGIFFSNLLLSLFGSLFYSKYSEFEGGNLFGNLLYLIVINVGFGFITSINKVKNEWYYYMCTFIVISNLFIRIPFGNRFIMLFGIVQILFFPLLFENNSLKRRDRGILLFCIIVYCIFTFSRLIGAGEIVPYLGIFEL